MQEGSRELSPRASPPLAHQGQQVQVIHISRQLFAFEIHLSGPLAGGFAPSLIKRRGADRVHSLSPKAQEGGWGGGALRVPEPFPP